MRTTSSNVVVQVYVRAASDPVFNRRSVARFRIACPVVLSRPGEAFGVVTNTENVSCKGFYCVSERPFWPHEKLKCWLSIPWALTGHVPTSHQVLDAVAEVVRVIPLGVGKGFGVACRLESYTPLVITDPAYFPAA
jgi:hypothetical protein